MKATDTRKKLDRRVLRTRKAIMNAFDKLVSNGNFDKLTVSAIAREADIDRKTFYLHYRSINDLANHKAEEAIERILNTVKAAGADKDHLERVHIILTEVNEIMNEDIVVYANIASHLSTDQVLERFEAAIRPALQNTGLDPDAISDQQLRMRLQFHIAGALSLYTSWLKSDRRQPIETVSSVIEDAIRVSYLGVGANA